MYIVGQVINVKQGQHEAQDRPLWNPRCHNQRPHTVFSQWQWLRIRTPSLGG